MSSSPVFSRTDTVTDSERFYNSILDFLEEPEEKQEVEELLVWWNRCATYSFYLLYLTFDLQTNFPELFIGKATSGQKQPLGQAQRETSAEDHRD